MVLLVWGQRKIHVDHVYYPHQENHLKEILDGIPTSQKRIGVEKWHRVIGGLCSMTIALPGAWGLFSPIQEALRHMEGERVSLTREIYQYLAYF